MYSWKRSLERAKIGLVARTRADSPLFGEVWGIAASPAVVDVSPGLPDATVVPVDLLRG
jgi:hypothetical protein